MTVDTTLPADVAQLTQRVAELERYVATLQDGLGMYRQILDAVPDMALCKGPQSRIVYANRAFREFYGMDQEQLQGMIDAPFVEPDYTQQYIKDDLHVFTTGETLNIPEEPITRYDGAIHHVHTVKSPLKNSTGQVVGTMGVLRDITAHKQAEADIQIYDRIVKHIPLGLMVLQLDQTGDPASFRLTTANPTAGELAGFDVEAEIG
jgi:PAS domain S-box-containing protein